MKLKYMLITLAVILMALIGGLFIMSVYQLKDFKKIPSHVPYSQIYNK